MNNFNKVCPSGNILIDFMNEYTKKLYINTKEELRDYLKETCNRYTWGELRSMLRSVNNGGLVC